MTTDSTPTAPTPADLANAAIATKIAPLLEYAAKVLATSKDPITEKTALYLILQVCMAEQLAFELYEINEAVRVIMVRQNKVLDTGRPHVLTWGDLRTIGAGLPDNTPVLYQRIEDGHFDRLGWKTRWLPWETSPRRLDLDPDDLSAYPGMRYVDVDGVQHLQQRTQYIDAFSAYVTTDDDGGKALCVHAHY